MGSFIFFIFSDPSSDFYNFFVSSIVLTSVVDPDPYWIRIQELPGSGSTHANIG